MDLSERLDELERRVEDSEQQSEELAEQLDEARSEAAYERAQRIVAEHSGKIAPGEQEKWVERAVDSPEMVETALSDMNARPDYEEKSLPDEEEVDDTAATNLERMQTFEDNMGVTEDGDFIVTTEADARVARDLGLSADDRR
jgi:uncharacterized coiled-coil protein SlyX